jgi:hypothetical protein
MTTENLLTALNQLETTLEVVQRNRYRLTGRTPYAKKARDQMARVKREVDSLCQFLAAGSNADQVEKLRLHLTTVINPQASVEEKLQATDSLRFILQTEIALLVEKSNSLAANESVPSEAFLPVERFNNFPDPVRLVVEEVNRSVLEDCANGASMLLRRLAEMLIEEGYELAGRSGDIKTPEGYVGFSELVGQATSGKVFNLPSPAKQGLKDIQSYGNGAAHSRFFVVKKDDLEKVRPKLRVCFDELGGRCDELRMLRRRGKSG